MDQIDQQIARWHDDGKPQAIVTLVRVYGSAPQPLGARMAVTDDLQFIGAVSGGCVEGDVISQASGVLSTGRPVLKTYGISDEAAWDVGLACGGTIEVFIEPFTAMHEAILDLQHQQRLFCVITILSGTRMGEKQIVLPDGYYPSVSSGLLSIGDLNHAVGRALSTQKSEKITAQIDQDLAQVFCEVFSPPARLLIVGAVQIAMPLVELARVVGFQTYVIDPRQVFANRERYPTADQIVVGWPADELEALTVDENAFIVFVSHDEKFDLPALRTALKSKARYIGALGSRTTHAARVEKLMQLGLQPEEIARIHAPIGLDIGAAGSQEIALAILAQMIAVKNGKNLPGKSVGSA